MVGVKSILGLSAAAAAAAMFCTPASAQQIYYEDGDYLYAVAAPPGMQDDVVTQTVVSPVAGYPTAQRVIPARTAPVAQVGTVPVIVPPATGYGYRTPEYPVNYSAPAYAAYPAARSIPARYGAPGHLPNGAQLVEFDRQTWLDECNYRIAQYDEHDRGRVIGALLGTLAGGIAGNRIADGDRLAGTLAGAGVGALAGGLVGDAIDDRHDAAYAYDRDYCAAYLDDYMAWASADAATFTYVPSQQYMLVPVTVQVAQEAVYREYIAPPR